MLICPYNGCGMLWVNLAWRRGRYKENKRATSTWRKQIISCLRNKVFFFASSVRMVHNVSKYSHSGEVKPTLVINWVEKGLIYTEKSINKNYNRNDITIFIFISLFLSSLYCVLHICCLVMRVIPYWLSHLPN